MAIKMDFSKMEIRPPSWSGGKSSCKNCSKTTYCNVGGPVPTKTDRWQDGFAYWWKTCCLNCGHGETKGKYIRALYLKRVGRFDPTKDL